MNTKQSHSKPFRFVKQYSQLRTATYCKTIPKIPQKSTATTDNSKDIYTSVVVNIKDFDIDEMFEKVKEEYDLMNGHAENLTIRLYDSRESLKNGDCLGEKVYSDCGKI